VPREIDGDDGSTKWISTRYHTPLDNMEQPINYEAGIKSGSMIFLLGIQDCTAGRSLPGTQMIF
jgi:hypothetical protein